MRHNNSEFLNITHRILFGFVALIILFTLVATPMKVDASAAAVAIGAAGSMTPVGLGIAAVALLIALTGAIITSSSDLAVESTSVYNSLDPSVQSWMDSTGQKLAAGGETISFVIPQTVINNFNNNYNKNDDDKHQLSANLPYVAIGADQLLQLDQLNPLQVMSSDVTGLLAQGVGTLAAISLLMQNLNYRTIFQYQTMHDAFYQEIVDTRLALNNTLHETSSGIYNRLGNLGTRMEIQFVDTRQALMNKMDAIGSDLYSNVSLVRNQIVGQLQSTTSLIVSPLIGIKTSLEGIASDLGSLDGSEDKDQVATIPGLSFPSLRESLVSLVTGATSFFDDSGGNNGDDDEESYPLIPPITNYFDKAVNPFLGVIRDFEFMAALEAFFSFVASLWLLFPLAIRYLISFGFGVPMTFSVIKMFMG